MTHRTLAVAYYASAAFSFGVLAAETSADGAGSAPARMLKSDYRMAKDRLEAEYRTAKEACEGKRRGAEQACLRDADASHEQAEKALRADFYGDRPK
jgi:hypothetical protein